MPGAHRPARSRSPGRRRRLRLVLPRLTVDLVVGAGSLGHERGATLAEELDPLLDAGERLDHVTLQPDEDADRVLVGTAPDPVGIGAGVGDDLATLGFGRLG